MSNYFIYIVVHYCDKSREKYWATVIQCGALVNLLTVLRDYDKITDADGNAATLESATINTKKRAFEIANTWNETWRNENKLFY